MRPLQSGMTNRNLFVVGPEGRIAYRAAPFREVDPRACTELGHPSITCLNDYFTFPS